MIDLFCLVADKNQEAALDAILRRPLALGIPSFQFETLVHPHRDHGCLNESTELLRNYRDRARHALVVMDREWDGAPAETGTALEELLEGRAQHAGLGTWARAVVIEPELESWVFSESPHVSAILGWSGRKPELREALQAKGLWNPQEAKPANPKLAMEWALREVWKPRSSSIYRQLAEKVSLDRCTDRAFLRFKAILRDWFSGEGTARPQTTLLAKVERLIELD